MLASHLECSIELGSIGFDSAAADQSDLLVECCESFHDAERASEVFDVSFSQMNRCLGS